MKAFCKKSNTFIQIVAKKRFFLFVMMVLVAGANQNANASSCYHHYNDEAWHGHGMAIVFCLNSGGYTYPADANNDMESLPMAACEVRYHSSGAKIMDFAPHIATDHERQIFSDYDTLGLTFYGHALDIVCTGKNNKTYTYLIPDAAYWEDPGVCPSYAEYQGSAAECVNDHNPILTVTKAGVGTGTVKGNVAGDVKGDINCGSSCKAHYQFYSRKQVTLTAIADPGYVFKKWTGACSGNSATCTLTMDGDKTVTAVFSRPVVAPANSLLLKK